MWLPKGENMEHGYFLHKFHVYNFNLICQVVREVQYTDWHTALV
jgi:hypothetical protein